MNIEKLEEICNTMTKEECAEGTPSHGSEAFQLLEKFVEHDVQEYMKQFRQNYLNVTIEEVEAQLPMVLKNNQDDEDLLPSD